MCPPRPFRGPCLAVEESPPNCCSVVTHPGAVASSRGERGKPSRGTSERGDQRELETLWSLSSFKWKQLHRALTPKPYPTLSDALPPPPTSSARPHALHPTPTSPHFHCHCTSHLVLSGSQCSPATGEWKECCSPTDSTTDSWFLYRWNISVSTLQRGGRGFWDKVKREKKQSCNNETRIPWREYDKEEEEEKTLFETVDVF